MLVTGWLKWRRLRQLRELHGTLHGAWANKNLGLSWFTFAAMLPGLSREARTCAHMHEIRHEHTSFLFWRPAPLPAYHCWGCSLALA